MAKRFSEEVRARCMHCGKWVGECTLSTLPLEVEDYGDYAICKECGKKYTVEYWSNWVNKKKGN